MSTQTSPNDALIKKLQTLAERKNAEEKQRVEALLEDQWRRLPDMKDFDYEKSRLVSGLKGLLDGLTGKPHFSHVAPQDFGREICELMEYTDRFPYQQWRVKKSIDPTATDEDNLELLRYFKSVVGSDNVERTTVLFMDMMLTMGKLARKLNSTILGRIVALIVKCKCINNNGAYNHQQAGDLTHEINECWWTLQTELELIDEEDKVDLYPTAPAHDDSTDDDDGEFDENQFSNDEDPDYATGESRDHALRQYRREHEGLTLASEFSKAKHPMDEFSKTLKKLADEMEAGTPSIDGRWNKFNYKFLSRVLAANFTLSYEDYERVEYGDDDGYCVRLEHNTCWEETKEEVLKKQIVTDLTRYLTAAAQLSQKINSRTYKNWTEMLALLENHGGEFHEWRSDDSLMTKKDLKRFIELFKPARQQIWSDAKVYLPAATKTVVDISDESAKKAATAIGEEFAQTKSDVAEIRRRVGRPEITRQDIIALVHDVATAGIKGIKSLPKAIGYIRSGVKSTDTEFYDRCMWAREYVKNHAKKEKNGVEKYWHSIYQNSKESDARQRSKDKNAAPGEVPTLING